MSTSELNPRGLRAYAVYFTVHFSLLATMTLVLQMLSGAHVVASVGPVLFWGWSSYRLSVRFFRGQGRAPSAAESRQLATYAALYSATSLVLARSAVVLLMANPSEVLSPEVSWTLLLAIEFFVTFVVHLLLLGVYLLPTIQERAFAIWRERNP